MRLAPVEVWVAVLVVAVGVALRFLATSPLWLDEALSVNIARLGIADLLDALRRDGHPPLYYLVLHGWMDVFGQGDTAVRALSGVFGVALLPLVWATARRRGGAVAATSALVLAAVTPFLVRYSTEARMYSMVSVLVLGGWLLADDLRRGPDRLRWLALAVVTGAALLTHYWAMYVGAAAVGLLALRWWRVGARAEALRIGSALAAGALLFVPWVPSFLYQVGHTGTPWGTATRPTRAATDLASDLGGRANLPEGLLFGLAVALLAAVGLLLVRARPGTLELDLRTVPRVRSELALVAATIAVGLAAGGVTNATFLSRYAAGVVPLVLVAAAVGAASLPSAWNRRIAVGAVVVLAAPGLAYNVFDDRTQGEQFATTILGEGGDGDLVAVCPDQLGPSTLRALPQSVEVVGVPALERPTLIDWVDYEDRNRAADPEDVVDELLARADGRAIWLVYSSGYRTYEGLCEGILSGLASARPVNAEVVAPSDQVYERASLLLFAP